jgi:DNA end-binding protein Ku
MVITTREHVVRIRSLEGVLMVEILEYAAQVRSPADFKGDLVDTHPTVQETKLTRQLIASIAEKKLDLAKYVDEYTNRVKELIAAKVDGKELVTPAPAEELHVINLMDALRASMAEARKAGERPARRKAPSVTKRPMVSKPAVRRKKSG